jgi:hypothetical protein
MGFNPNITRGALPVKDIFLGCRIWDDSNDQLGAEFLV